MSKVLLSGAPCSGKTTLINKVLNQQTVLPFNINLDSITSVNANIIRQSPNTNHSDKDTVLLHFDHMRPYKRQQVFDVNLDPFLGYLSRCNLQDDLIVVTLLAPLDKLTTRIIKRIQRLSNESKLSSLRLEKLNKLLFLYANKDLYLKHTTAWLTFATQLNAKNHYFYIDRSDENQVFIQVNSIEEKLSLLSSFYQ